MPLSDAAIRAAKPTEKPVKLFDEKGLYLLVQPGGSRGWRLKYRIAGREKLLSLGVYPETSLRRAREKRDEARRLLADGIDPSARRKSEKVAQAHTFEAIAREWLEVLAKQPKGAGRPPLSAGTRLHIQNRLEKFIFPRLGKEPIAKIEAPALLEALRRIENRGTHETAHRTRSDCSRVFRYAIVTGRATRDVCADLRGALAPAAGTHFASITEPARIGELLRVIDGFQGQLTTAIALKLAPLVFVRPGELRKAQWEEFELEGKEPTWRIPAARMKMREAHVVPLSKQAVALLKELHQLTGPAGYVFPGLRTSTRPISENTVNAALRRLGYSKEEMTGHGFRSMASTCLNEQGWHPDLIELQLAHAERNEVRAAYNRASRLPERRKMMQDWANYLEKLKAGANVVPIRGAA